MRYLPHTPEEIQAMLAAAGLRSVDELFDSIPEGVRARAAIDFAPALGNDDAPPPGGDDEPHLMRHVAELAARNTGGGMLSFLGAGAYDHVFPLAADQLLTRSELYTAYTPYQAEVAQGTLQIIFEFQTIVSEILGLPVANASMYDASTGLAEAVVMARRLTGRERSIISGCVHPHYAATVETFIHEIDHGEPQITAVPVGKNFTSDVDALVRAIDAETACVVVGHPSFYGTVTDLRALAAAAHDAGALLVTATQEPFALALIEPPGALGADIAVAEGQPLGLPPQYGGPGVGLFACRQDRKFLQQIPGRLCGETVDKDGRRGYVLTLSTREQHIRRERATSNICTNSGLCATALTIKMCMLGKQGFVGAAEQCLAKAEYLKQQIAALRGYSLLSSAPTFNELAIGVRGGNARDLVTALTKDGILAGVDLGAFDPELRAGLLVAVTERHRRADLDRLVAALDAYAA
jgi:glycine cleavage system P protein (glycine dehydrogenase) subunit 1